MEQIGRNLMMRKTLCTAIVFMLLISAAGCASQSPASNPEPTWVVTIEGAGDTPVEFSDLDVEKIGTVEIKAIMKKKDGSEVEQQWTGVPLIKVLEFAGIKEYSTVTVEAEDGYSKEYTPDIVESEGTILGLKVDGKDLDEESGPVQLVVNGKGSNWWVKKAVKIRVVK